MITYHGSRSISGNPILRQYELEDITSRLLFETGYNPRLSLRVDAEAFARHIGVHVRAAYLSDDPYSLCAVAFDEQTLRTEKGSYRMRYGDALVELAILDRGDRPLYDYGVVHAAAHFYLHSPESKGVQLSFDLIETESENHRVCDIGDLLDAFEELGGDDEKEALADNFTGCVLLPKNPFKQAANAFLYKHGINRAGIAGDVRADMVAELSSAFGAPPFAVLLRLKKLLYI